VGDDDADEPEPPSAKVVTALLREARSLARRGGQAQRHRRGVGDPATQQLTAEACTSIEQLVHHLMLLTSRLARR
jgi:hypothetical protein